MQIGSLVLGGDALERMAQVALVVAGDGRIIDANLAAAELYGYSTEELRSMGVDSLRDSEQNALIVGQMAAAAKSGITFETTHRRSDGTIFPAEVRSMPVVLNGEPALLSLVDDITARKTSDAALVASRQRLAQFFTASPDGTLVSRLDSGFVLDANDKLAEMTGWRREDMIGRTTLQLGMWAYPAERAKFLDRLHEFGSVQGFEVKFRTRDGAVWDGLISGNVIQIDGEDCLLSVVTDITELKSTQEELQRLNRIFAVLGGVNGALVKLREPTAVYEETCRLLVEAGGFRLAWVGIVDADGVTVRPVAHAGAGEDYVAGVDIVLDDVLRSQGPVGRAISSGRHFAVQDIEHDPRMIPWRESAREHGYLSCGAFPLRADGKVVGSVNIYAEEVRFFGDRELDLLDELVSDVSFALEFYAKEERRRAAEAALDASEMRYRLFVESSQDLIWEVNEIGVFTFIGPQSRSVLGYEPAELLGKSPLDLMSPEEASRIYDEYVEVLSAAEPFREFMNVYLHKDGTSVPVTVSGVPFFDDRGDLRGYTGSSRTIVCE